LDEVISNPVKSRIVIGGYDALSVDLVGATSKYSTSPGSTPMHLEHLVLAQKLFGVRDVNLIGKNIEDVKKVYKRESLMATRLRYTWEKILSYVYRALDKL